VSFWVSFIGCVVGIVLSLVAIVFSVLVDRRSSTISDKTIQSLQKIESAVERSSSDTRELIKAGWDKMLGNVDRSTVPTASNESSAKEVAAGIAAELRSELTALNAGNGKQNGQSESRIDHLEEYLKSLEASLKAQLRTAHADARPSAKFEGVLETVRKLSEPTYALLRAIAKRHLTEIQYRSLSKTKYGVALRELREAGLLAPVVGKGIRGPELCYYFPPEISKIVRAVLEISPEPPEEVQRKVALELLQVKYLSHGTEPEESA
jgi:hypothetical protein